MGWILKGLTVALLSVIDSLMVWCASLMRNLELDIGISKGMSPLEVVSPETAGANGLLGEIFPGAEKFCILFSSIAMILVFMIMIFKLWQGFIAPFTESEPPGGVVLRSLLATAGVCSSYTIFVTIEMIFNLVYTEFKALFDETVDKASFAQFADKSDSSGSWDHVNQFWGSDKLINPNGAANITGGGDGTGISMLVIELIIGIAIVFAFAKLMVEIYQRYLTLGLLFYTCPLAFAMLASKSTSKVTGSWIQMVISQLILMCMNLFFIGVFIGSFWALLTRKGTYMFDSDVEFVTTMICLLGWLIVGQRVDEYMRGLGLSIANTGAGIGATLVAAGMTAQKMVGSATRGAAFVGRTARGAAEMGGKIGESIGSKIEQANGMYDALEPVTEAEKAKNELSGAQLGDLSGEELKENAKARGYDVPGINDVDWNESSKLSGNGAQVLVDGNGNLIDESIIPGSPAAQALEDSGICMRTDGDVLKPIYDTEVDKARTDTFNTAKEGKLLVDPKDRSKGFDQNKYTSIAISGKDFKLSDDNGHTRYYPMPDNIRNSTGNRFATKNTVRNISSNMQKPSSASQGEAGTSGGKGGSEK